MKLKHNKKRNTAFLNESLIKELTVAIVRKNNDRKNEDHAFYFMPLPDNNAKELRTRYNYSEDLASFVVTFFSL